MPRFIVEKREIWIQMVEIEAPDMEEVKFLVSSGGGRRLDKPLKYDHDLSEEFWTVEPSDGEEP